MPRQLKYEIQQCLKDVQQDKLHCLKPFRRLAIYRAIYPSINESVYKELLKTGKLSLSSRHRRYGHLGILTAEYVLPIWDSQTRSLSEDDELNNAPRRILIVAQQVLTGALDPVTANGFYLQDFYYLTDSASFVCSYRACLVLDAAYQALGMALGVAPFYGVAESSLMRLEEGKVPINNDAAFAAMSAYSLLDDHPPGTWLEAYFSNKDIFHLDSQKRWKFWKWWLTEAVPAAWKMAKE